MPRRISPQQMSRKRSWSCKASTTKLCSIIISRLAWNGFGKPSSLAIRTNRVRVHRCRSVVTSSQLPRRKHLGSRRKFYVAVLRPGTADHGELDIVAPGELGRVCEIFKFVQAWGIRRCRAVIVDEHAI